MEKHHGDLQGLSITLELMLCLRQSPATSVEFESELGRKTHGESHEPGQLGPYCAPTQVHLCCPVLFPRQLPFLPDGKR